MDSVNAFLVVLGLVCVLSVQTGYGELMCYNCNSSPDYDGKDCEGDSPKLEPFSVNCTERGINDQVEYKYCRKTVQDVEGDYRVVRSCATGGRVGECIDRTGTKEIKITYCECEGNLCNSANTMFTMSMLLLTISSALLALICHS
jgi:hypothetical protein